MARKKDISRRRKTIMLDMNNKYKIQMLQAKLVEISENSISFSYAVEKVLAYSLQLTNKAAPSVRNEFPSDRVTIMISAKIDAKIKMALSHDIRECAKEQCTMPATSYSRIINSLLIHGLDAGAEKKIISNAKKGI